MKAKTILFFLCLPLFGVSQNNSIDIYGSLDWTYRYLTSDDEFGGKNSPFLTVRDDEMPELNWALGLNYNRKISEKWYFKTGVRFAVLGYETGIRYLYWPSEYDDEGNFVDDPDLPSAVKWDFDYFFLEIPILFRYELNQKTWAPFVEAGLSPSFHLTTKQTTFSNGERIVEYDDEAFVQLNRFHIVGNLSLGINRKLSTNWQLFGQSVFRCHLTKAVDNIVREYLYSLGWEMGIRRKF